MKQTPRQIADAEHASHEAEIEENCQCGIDRNGSWSDEVFNRFGCGCYLLRL